MRVLIVAVNLCMKQTDVNVTFWLWNRPLPVHVVGKLYNHQLHCWLVLDSLSQPWVEEYISYYWWQPCDFALVIKKQINKMSKWMECILWSSNVFLCLSGLASFLRHNGPLSSTSQSLSRTVYKNMAEYYVCPYLKITLFIWFIQFHC